MSERHWQMMQNEKEDWPDPLEAELTRLRAEVESLRADAERYRWLRDEAPADWVNWADEREENNTKSIDAAIDAARAALKETKP